MDSFIGRKRDCKVINFCAMSKLPQCYEGKHCSLVVGLFTNAWGSNYNKIILVTYEENVRYDMPNGEKTSPREFSPDNKSDRRQSKTRLKIDERGSKIARNSNFDCRLTLFEQQMAINNSVSNDFFYLRSSKV